MSFSIKDSPVSRSLWFSDVTSNPISEITRANSHSEEEGGEDGEGEEEGRGAADAAEGMGGSGGGAEDGALANPL